MELSDFTGKDGLIPNLPAKRKKRLALYALVMTKFDAEKIYSEPEVNAILQTFFVDYALTRRELVDYGFLTRTIDDREYRVNKNLDVQKLIKLQH